MTLPAPDWQSDCGTIRLFNRDCLELLPLLPPGSVDTVTDPPYGIGEAAGKNSSRGQLAQPKDYGYAEWDNTTNQPAIDAAMRASKHSLVFGGNYYLLPPSSCWLVWDKLNSGDFADCELVWTNLPKAVRIIRHRWNGMIREGNEERFHPTQKPLAVMKWCLSHLPADAHTIILDPFLGSGTTAVACALTGRSCIGIEIEPRYFDIAVRRVKEALGYNGLFRGHRHAANAPAEQSLFASSGEIR